MSVYRCCCKAASLEGMASLEKLAIRGIRAFSPDDEQAIEFYSPLTMIVGQNGSGKTTIIECLRYASTGKLPPGGASSAGQSWVHDPKLADAAEVKASVKLRFKGKTDKRMVVIRSLQLLYKGKGKTAQFKQLEGVVRTINPETRKSENMGHKCADLNTFLPEATGISAAILDSVVFCHQEESSWPLQEGATLKKKFDDIFESTRYTKALEAIEKCRKQKSEEQKGLKEVLAGLSENREASLVIMREIEAKQDEVEKLKEEERKQEELDQKMVQKREEAEGKLRRFEAKAKDIEKKKVLIAEKGRGLQDKKKSLGQEMRESTEELNERLKTFQTTQAEAVEKMNRLRSKMAVEQKAIERANVDVTKLVGQRGSLEANIVQQDATVADRNNEIRTISNKHGVTLPKSLASDAGSKGTADVPEADVKEFLASFQAKRDAVAKELENMRQENGRELESKRADLSKVDVELRTIASQKEEKLKQLKKYEYERKTALQESRSATQGDESDVKRAKAALDDKKRELTQMENEMAQLDLDKKIKDATAAKTRAESEAGEARREHDEALESAKGLLDLQSKQNHRRQCLQRLQTACEEFNQDHAQLLGEELQAEPSKIQDVYRSVVDKKMKILEDRLNTARKDQTDGLLQLKEKEQALRGYEKELEQLSSKIAKLDNSKATKVLQDIVETFPKNKELTDATAAIKHLGTIYKGLLNMGVSMGTVEFVKRLTEQAADSKSKDKPECPCCSQSLSSNYYDVLIKRLGDWQKGAEAQLVQLPDVLKTNPQSAAARAKELLLRTHEATPTLVELQPSLERQKELQERMEKDRSNLRELAEKLERTKEALKEEMQLKSKWEQLLDKLKDVQAHAGVLGRADLDVKLASATAPSTGGQSLEELKAEQDAKEQAASDSRAQLDGLRDEKDRALKKLGAARQAVRQWEQLFEECSREYERQQRLIKQANQAKELAEETEREIQRLVNVESPKQTLGKKLKNELERIQKTFKGAEDVKQRAVMDCRQQYSMFEQLCRRVSDAESEGYKTQLKKLEQDMEKLKKDIEEAQQRINDLRPQHDQAQKAVMDKEALKKQIQDNLAYRAMVHEKEVEDRALAELESQLEEEGSRHEIFESVQRYVDASRAARDKKVKTHATIATLLRIQQEQQAKLRGDKYRDIEKRWRDAKIKGETVSMAISDLQKYYKALDRALMQYHKIKIEEINKIVRELWTRTYQGNDIEDIQIVSGEEGGAKAARSYNYRVVMKKGQAYLDMRGRCSAGQRVLASIVIRLALAETFCASCGVMALDEPTTNLDHENKGGLARALARLIAERSRQSNFQLIIITHDEEFVETMKQELSTISGFSMPEHYWRISRKEATHGRAYSKIERIEWSG